MAWQLRSVSVLSGRPGRVFLRALLAVLVLLLTGLMAAARPAAAQGSVTTHTGVLNGAAYVIQVPATWNGTLLLWSHGYRAPGAANPAESAPAGLAATLLAQGYALAGSSFATTGWAVEVGLRDQMALLNYFQTNIATPRRVIAWGGSLGGLITAGLIQENPGRFSGALAMCGALGGAPGNWNMALDGAFVFKTLLAPNAPLQLVNITNPQVNVATAVQALDAAQATPQGRARLALAAAVAATPGWFTVLTPEPAAGDYITRQYNQYLWLKNIGIPFTFGFRANVEQLAGANPSGNVGVNYLLQLDRSGTRGMVEALYQQAGLDLAADLAALDAAPRISANAFGQDYLSRHMAFNGRIAVPLLTLHTTDDGLVAVQNEEAYRSVVNAAGGGALLRQMFVRRAGHCTFSAAETLVALQTLERRLTSGQWDDTSNTAALNAQALALGPPLNVISPSAGSVIPAPPAFTAYQPSGFLRPFTTAAPDLAPSYVTPLEAKGPDGPTGAGIVSVAPGTGAYRVRITLTGLQPGTAHAVRFHRGTCDIPGPTLQPMPNLLANDDGIATVTAWIGQRDWATIVGEPAYISVASRGTAPYGSIIACGNVN